MVEAAQGNDAARVVLLNPPTADTSGVIILGLAYLSAALKRAGHRVLVLDATSPARPLSEAEVARRIRQFDPHFVGITLTVDFIVDSYAYMQRLRKLGYPLVAGGPHASGLPEEVLRHGGADIVALGEGEEAVVELAEHFLGRRPLSEIAGLVLPGNNGDVARTRPRPRSSGLDAIPFPDHESFPIANYTGSSDPDSHPIFWSIFTSRGCPFNCTFCSNVVFGRLYRARSPENVLAEIRHLVDNYGARFFALQDDEAFVNERRMLAFCEAVCDSGLNVQFSARLRIDTVTEPMLRALLDSGFRRLSFGVESWNDETLARVNKRYKVEQIKRGFELVASTGFPTVSFNNIVGFPWETEAHLRANLDAIATIPPNVTCFSFVATPIPYPGTPLYEEYHERYGFTDWWLDPARNSQAAAQYRRDAFFLDYASCAPPLYDPLQNQYWDYPPPMKRAVDSFCWSILRGSLKRCVTYPEYLFMYYGSRVSYWLSKRSPRLERALMWPFKKLGRWLRLPERVVFARRR